MASLEEMTNALREADRKGNTEDAQRIAQMIQKARGQAQPQQGQQQETRQQEPSGVTFEQKLEDLGETARATGSGVADAAFTIGSGIVLEPLAGFAGLEQGIVSAVRGDDDILGAMVDRIDEVRSRAPELDTRMGREIAGNISAPFEAFSERVVDPAADAAFRVGGPAAGAGVKTTGEALPEALGLKGSGRALRSRRADIKEAERFAREEGIDLRKRGETQGKQIEEAGARTSETGARGESMPEVQEAVKKARKLAKDNVDEKFSIARAERAGVPVPKAREFIDVARESLSDFPVSEMPAVRRRLSELEEISALPENATVNLNAAYNWRRKLNRDRPATTDLTQHAALDILKGQFDNFMQTQFNADMISGNPAAVAKWRDAIQSHRKFKETFDNQRAIRDLSRKEATPEEMRNWVFGASQSGFKSQAGQTVGTLKDIIGKDSPQFNALRDDAALNIIDPLLSDTPNLRGYITRYDRLVRNNKTVADELFTPEQLQRMKKLRDFASANLKRGQSQTQRFSNKSLAEIMADAGSVIALGHGIARAGMKVRLARKLGQGLIERGNKRKFLSEVFGYDMSAPLIPKTPVVIQGATETARGETESRQPMGAVAQ